MIDFPLGLKRTNGKWRVEIEGVSFGYGRGPPELTATAGGVAGCGAPPRNRRGAGVAFGPLGPIRGGLAGNPPETGPLGGRVRFPDRSPGPDDTSRPGHGRFTRPSSPSSSGRFRGNGCAPVCPMPGRTASGWAGPEQRRQKAGEVQALHRASVSKAEIARQLMRLAKLQ